MRMEAIPITFDGQTLAVALDDEVNSTRLHTSAGDTLTIPELMEEQRAWVRSSVPAERFAAALLLSGVLAGRLRELGDLELGQVLDREVCSNLSVLAPELTVCIEAANRLCRHGADKTLRPRRSQATKHDDGDHTFGYSQK
jgi:hypothetical protein